MSAISGPERFVVLHDDSPVRFRCTECGECCFDQTVMLEPQDLFRLTRDASLAPSTTALFAAGMVALDPQQRCELVMRSGIGGSTMCRFLSPLIDESNRVTAFRCGLHERGAKPFVCKSSPIARPLDGETYRFVAPVEGCPGMNRGDAMTTRNLLDDAGIDQRSEQRSLWFHRELRPTVVDRSRAMRVYDFDAGGLLESLDALDAYLRAL
jgi:Fe-S-cluster containining protein